MVQKFVILFLVMMVVLVGCGKDESRKLEVDVQPSVAVETTKEVVVTSAKELEGIKAKKITWKKDGEKMVLVKPYVPAQYEEKATFDPVGNPITKKVKVSDASPSLWMDATEVTVGQFKKFLKSTDHTFDDELWAKVDKYSPTAKHPMMFVTRFDAQAYCEWAGKRLPTEKEWEFAARGGLVGKKSPWGDKENVGREYANYEGAFYRDQWDETTAPVGSFRPNGYGLHDMAGNVYEWCQDWYDSDHSRCGLRGGSWDSFLSGLRVDDRRDEPLYKTNSYIGFRCVSGFPAAKQ